MSDSKLIAYQKLALWPLTVLSLLFLAGYLVESFEVIILGLDERFFSIFNIGIWLVFAIDYLVMLYLAVDRKYFFRTHLFDLLLVIVPHIRGLRALRILLLFERVVGGLKGKIYISIPYYVAGAATLLILLSGGAIYQAESKMDSSNIKTPGDALWWATVTVTTVGYGDRFPVSTEGRWIAVALMISGIAVVGSITASLAAWIVNKVNDEKSKAK